MLVSDSKTLELAENGQIISTPLIPSEKSDKKQNECNIELAPFEKKNIKKEL